MADKPRAIVAGYDGSPGSKAALEWAMTEAGIRETTLTVCHVWAANYQAAPGAPAGDEPARQRAERVLAEGLRDLRPGDGGPQVHPLLVSGAPARVLCDQGRDGDLIVVGSRGAGGLAGLLLGSVGLQVAAHAPGPVTVVRGHWRPVPGHRPRPVAVGADGSPASQAAVRFAIEEAALRDVPLLAVCALSDTAGAVGGAHRLETDFDLVLAKALADFPDVTLRRQVEQGPPRAALLEAAEQAQLLVIGARGRGGLRAMMLGSVSQALLQHASCPVAVVRQ